MKNNSILYKTVWILAVFIISISSLYFGRPDNTPIDRIISESEWTITGSIETEEIEEMPIKGSSILEIAAAIVTVIVCCAAVMSTRADFPEGFSKIDRMPKFRCQRARGRIPDEKERMFEQTIDLRETLQ